MNPETIKILKGLSSEKLLQLVKELKHKEANQLDEKESTYRMQAKPILAVLNERLKAEGKEEITWNTI